ncbi:PREDICTED: E3 ubiquitin-protein ligase SHPRH-like [Priapulus caudatus]|uniref:E3 ubiquitin-protein ligase SHPRH-like n=1 Tax=Priapulus caudatus TaxID=37621 RepID=A0ABM1F6Q5_PRICU|nr:PREDICTED: E3 ubiquitin-protein ligase SHPRH-like [Priapulus caudatus]
MNIQREDASAKSLVFSAWQDVLNIVGQALKENNITHRMLHANNKFQDNLSAFKHDPDISALLLPVNSGAKGLNLIEATHVLLVEPILNPANQLQAIGRVHRIGQTK